MDKSNQQIPQNQPNKILEKTYFRDFSDKRLEEFVKGFCHEQETQDDHDGLENFLVTEF